MRDPESMANFKQAVHDLLDSGRPLLANLDPIDVLGAYITAGICLAESNGMRDVVVKILRTAADEFDAARPTRKGH